MVESLSKPVENLLFKKLLENSVIAHKIQFCRIFIEIIASSENEEVLQIKCRKWSDLLNLKTFYQ